MKLSRFLQEQHILLGLAARDERDLLRQALDAAPDECFAGSTRDDVLAAIIAREARGTTILGADAFLPPARVAGLERPFLLLATCEEPVEVVGLDHSRALVRLAFILVTPASRNTFMLQAMAAIARLLTSNPEEGKALLGIRTPSRLLRHLEDLAVDIKNLLLAADVMSADPPALSPTMKLAEAVHFLVDADTEALAVVDAAGALVGEVGVREVLTFAVPRFLSLLSDTSEIVNFEAFARYFENEQTTTVAEIMNEAPLKVGPEAGVMDVAHQLLESGESKAYVVSGKGVLVGEVGRLALLRRVFAA